MKLFRYVKLGGALYLTCTLLLSLFLNGLLVSPAKSEDSLEMTVKAGFSGYARRGHSFPVYVTVENKGPDIKGRLEISSATVDYGGGKLRVLNCREISLPSGSKKKLELYITGSQEMPCTVRLYSGESELASAKIKLTYLQPMEMVVGVMSENSSTMDYLAALPMPQKGQRVTVIHLGKEDVPSNALLLENLDVLVFNNFPSNTLSAKQMTAIKGWIEQGGLLILAGGVNWQKTLKPFAEDILPVDVSGSKKVSAIPEIERFTGQQLKVNEEFIISRGNVREGTVLASAGEVPLIVEKKTGSGNVVYVGYDLAMEPFLNWQGNQQLWENIISRCDPHHIISTGRTKEEMMYRRYNFGGFLGRIPATDLPSGGVLAIILLVYVVLLGPGVYFILKKLDRRDLGWVVIPLLAVILFGGNYFFGFKNKGRDVFTSLVSLVVVEPGSEYARANSFIGVFAPTRSEYSFELPGEKLVEIQPSSMHMPIPNMPSRMVLLNPGSTLEDKTPVFGTVTQGDLSRVDFTEASRWSIRTVRCDEMLQVNGSVEGNLYTEEGRIKGTLVNRTGYDLHDCILYSRCGYQKIPRFLVGESIQVDFMPRIANNNPYLGPIMNQVFNRYPVHKPYGFREKPDRTEMITREVMEMTVAGGETANYPVILMGHSTRVPDGIVNFKDKGMTYQSAVFVFPFNLKMSDGNRVSIPPGIVNGRIVAAEARNFHSDIYGYNLENGSGIFQLDLPLSIDNLEVVSLRLYIAGDRYRTPGMVQYEIFNWTSGVWDALAYFPGGIPIKGDQYISDTGSIQVRITTGENQHFFLSGISISMEGHYTEAVDNSKSKNEARGSL